MDEEASGGSQFTDVEREAIILNAVRGMVDDMVNCAIFMPLGEKLHDTNLIPTTAMALRQFGTLMRDFLSPVTSRSNRPLPFGLPTPPNGDNATDHTTLFYLRLISSNPLIGTETESLRTVVHSFAEWLDERVFVPEVWLSNISVKIDLRIRRIDFIRISGDIGKHNFLRLSGQARHIRRILAENDVKIDEAEAYLAIPDAWDWFHTHLVAFHASNIAEFLNNIRFGIRDYISPVAKKAFFRIDDLRYGFRRPDSISDNFAKAQYFDLLRSTLAEPYFPKFSVSQSFKTQF